MRFAIESVGLYLPPTIQTAEELAPLVGKSAQWIIERTGVKERRIAHERMDVMGAKAALQAIGDGPPPDLVINASLSPVQLIPDSSSFIMKELGLQGVPGFSVHATCMSFLTALHLSASLLNSGAYKRILIVSSEQGSVSRDYSHPESAVLIGDGAAAALVTLPKDGENSAMLAFRMETYPDAGHLAVFQGAGTAHHPNDPRTKPEHNRFRMAGPGIYRRAVLYGARLVAALLKDAELTGEDIQLVVPHQTSGPGLTAVTRFSELREDRMANYIARYGNCIAASMPMALATAVQEGRVNRGDHLFLLGTGAGLSVSGAVLRW